MLWPLLHLGRAEEALAAREALVRLPAEADAAVPWPAAPNILCLAALGRTAEARAALARLPWEDEAVGTSHLLAALAAAVELRDREMAAEASGRLAGLAGLASTGVTLTGVARHLGAAAALLGDHAAARRYTEQALAVAGQVRNRPEVALSRLQLVELLLDDAASVRATPASPVRDEAVAHLDFVIPEIEAMGMRPALERAMRLRERAGGRRDEAASATGPVPPDGLSAREVEVLGLIAAGLTNQEIADRLVLSLRTVERHTVNIYAKIGARGRAEAVAYALRHDLGASATR
jgi:ATP/maltotriose-dependent transcriptional regulator MalT